MAAMASEYMHERNRLVIFAFGVPHTSRTIAQRVAVSTAVSWYTLPTPLRFPM